LRDGIRQWREISVIGLPASLSTSLNPVALGIATAAVATLGTSEVAAFGLVTKIEAFAVVPLLALSSASAPFAGQNSGADKEDRTRAALWWCCGIAVVWTVLVSLLLLASARSLLLPAFSEDAEVIELAGLYLLFVSWTFAGYGITVALSAAMNGLGRPISALAIAGGRAMALLAPAAWLGVSLGGFQGVALGIAAANSLAGLVSVLIIARHSLTVREDGKSRDTDGDAESADGKQRDEAAGATG
jgi:Na+-driven multidrug efflux pump